MQYFSGKIFYIRPLRFSNFQGTSHRENTLKNDSQVSNSGQEIRENRESKKRSIEKLTHEQNKYLQEHKRAKEATAIKRMTTKINKLKTENWLTIKAEDRKLTLCINDEALAKEAELDGCYVIKTDLSANTRTPQTEQKNAGGTKD